MIDTIGLIAILIHKPAIDAGFLFDIIDYIYSQTCNVYV